jgi:serine protease Do
MEVTMTKGKLVASLIAAGLVGSSVGYSAATFPASHLAAATKRPVAAAVQRAAPAVNAAGLPDFSALVEKYGKAVVNITVTQLPQGDDAGPDFPQLDPNDPLSQFFKRFQSPSPGRMPVRGVGSGFIVRADGVILTNAHVVDGAKEVDVKLTDKREFKAKVLGVDKLSDIAVIKIAAKDLPTVKLGNPANIKEGDWVAAIGSPFGFENSITQGIVSAKSRALPDETYVPFIQTDVPINPGNSGGPLFQLNGEVIGVNSQIYSTSGGSEGLSFAIPIDIAMNVEHQILEHGKVTRGRLGVTVQAVTQDIADAFGLERPSGALISAVEPGGPAAKAGLESGDVIVKLNGAPIIDSAQLPAQIAQSKPGTAVKLEVMRKGKPQAINATLGELKNTRVASYAPGSEHHARLGVAVRPLTQEEQRQAGDTHGVVVERVTGAAAQAGIEPGDLILAVDGKPVSNAQQLRALVEHGGRHVALLVQRNDTRLYVPVELG